MGWVKLDAALLRTAFTDTEIQALDSVEVVPEVAKILDEECSNVANVWRGRIRRTWHVCDRRDGYVPRSLLAWILVHARYNSCTRIPNSSFILDDRRVQEYNRALQELDNLKQYEPETPDEPESPESPVPVIIANDRLRRIGE